jgi:hypothetical protein
MTADLAAVVLADMLCAAADDLRFPLRRRDAERLAARSIEHLATAGWQVDRRSEP